MIKSSTTSCLRVFFNQVNLYLILFPVLFSAQHYDTLKLSTIDVLPRFHCLKENQNLRKADSLLLHELPSINLGQLLQLENSVQIKSYGLSGSSSSSVRGGNSSHTSVLWNGMNMRNPMLGENDFSLVSTFLLDQVNIQYGGSAAMWGNASVSGAVHLNNNSFFDSGFGSKLFLSTGSFGQQSSGAKVSYGNKKFYSSTRFIILRAENDFNYRDANGNLKKINKAHSEQLALMHEDSWRVNKNNTLSFRYWVQNSDREIPPAINQFEKKSFQQDGFNRFMLDWQFSKGAINTFIRQGVFFEKLHYSDSLINLNTRSLTLTSNTDLEIKIKIDSLNYLGLGINNTNCSAKSDAYVSNVNQNFLSTYLNFSNRSFSGRNLFFATVRQEYAFNIFQPITFSVSDKIKLNEFLSIKIMFSKLYRLPTFNNLYWNPGGNPELLPEEGYSADGQIEFKHPLFHNAFSRSDFQSSVGVFTRNINNWIIWLPNSNGLWSPQNILKVWSRGVESYSFIEVQRKKVRYKFLLQTNYVLSTNQQSSIENDQSVGRQLIYTPVYSGSGIFQIQTRKLYFALNHSYTGYRYTSSDNYSYLSPFSLTGAVFGYKFLVSNYTIDLNFVCNNIFSSNYQVITQRPMPLVNYQINLILNYSPLKK
ncbi:MAG: TonB-dependent receptor plug domain-containing protein [Bacteroidota bacterium]|jgi:vitamin B12 transporter